MVAGIPGGGGGKEEHALVFAQRAGIKARGRGGKRVLVPQGIAQGGKDGGVERIGHEGVKIRAHLQRAEGADLEQQLGGSGIGECRLQANLDIGFGSANRQGGGSLHDGCGGAGGRGGRGVGDHQLGGGQPGIAGGDPIQLQPPALREGEDGWGGFGREGGEEQVPAGGVGAIGQPLPEARVEALAVGFDQPCALQGDGCTRELQPELGLFSAGEPAGDGEALAIVLLGDGASEHAGIIHQDEAGAGQVAVAKQAADRGDHRLAEDEEQQQDDCGQSKGQQAALRAA